IGNQAVGANGASDVVQRFGGQALGGAIANAAAPLTIANSTFTDNQAKGGNGGNNLNGIDGAPAVGFTDGGAIVNVFFGALTVTNTTFTGNQALGGSGGPGYTGGTGFGGGFNNNADSTAMVSYALFLDNQAVGGAGGSGAAGGVGAGGALANGGGFGPFLLAAIGGGNDSSSLALGNSTLIANVAQGGAGGAGGNGGNGLGGGVYNDTFTTLTLTQSTVTLNDAD